MTTLTLRRRSVLRGAGVALGLPWLEAMIKPGRAKASAAGPRRMAFVYIPNGVHMPAWRPDPASGTLGDLPPSLAPLRPFVNQLLVLSGLGHKEADPKGDGGGGHTSGSSAILTAVHSARQTPAFRAGVSVDQICASRIGHLTRLPSIELGCERGRQAGICDSGDSCAYLSNISWRTPTMPMPPEIDPRLVFERLFGDSSDGKSSRVARLQEDRSILDFVGAGLRRLERRIGTADRARVDQFATSVREVERQIGKAIDMPPAKAPAYPKPSAIPTDFARYIRTMADLNALAFATDTTRISTFMFAQEESNRAYAQIGVQEGHHGLSHHGGNPTNHAKLALINRFHMEQVAYFLGKLRAIKEGDATMLDNAMVVVCSGISDGDRHNHDDLPVLLAGGGGGTIDGGRHVQYPAKQSPMADLFVSMLDRMGTPVETFGDSRGPLPDLRR